MPEDAWEALDKGTLSRESTREAAAGIPENTLNFAWERAQEENRFRGSLEQ